MGPMMIERQTSDLCRFGNLIARSRRDARRIIADGKPNMRYRLRLIGERLVVAFSEINARTTLEQRLMLIGANPADARDMESGKDSMMHLLWGYSLEWSAMRRGDERNEYERAPLYWTVAYLMIEWMGSDEAKPHVDKVMRETLGETIEFEKLATRKNR